MLQSPIPRLSKIGAADKIMIAALAVATIALRVPPPLLCATPGAAFTESPGWPPVEKALDQLPVFTVANNEGKPLQYEFDGKPVALFYADVEAAKNELSSAQEQFPDLGCDIIPFGLGRAYVLQCEDKAMLVPSVKDLSAAGLPAGMPAVGQPLPLFACMEMSREGPTGTPVLPLFMSHADCVAAVKQATSSDLAEGEEKLEVVGLSLPNVVERLSSVADDAPGFTFIAPAASAEHIRAYLGTEG